MSSIVKRIVTSAPRTGLPPRVIATEKVFGNAARFGATRTCERVRTRPHDTRDRARADVRAHAAQAGERLRRRRQARQHGRREHRRDDEHDLGRDRPSQERRRALGEVWPDPRRGEARSGHEQVDGAEQHRNREQRRLDEDRLAVARVPQARERREVQVRGDDARREQRHHRDERDLREARYDEREGRAAATWRRREPQHEQTQRARRATAIRSPGAPSRAPSARAAGDVWAACPAMPGISSTAPGRDQPRRRSRAARRPSAPTASGGRSRSRRAPPRRTARARIQRSR